MVYLKPANAEDAAAEAHFLSGIPEDENGFTNPWHGCTEAEFRQSILPQMLKHAQGLELQEGYVPQSSFFLWEDAHIVGLFHIRHYLNNTLRNGAGHIGACIGKEYRGRGLGTQGLALAIEKAKKLIREDEIYLSVNRSNLASLAIQINNGAYIHHSSREQHFTRIRL